MYGESHGRLGTNHPHRDNGPLVPFSLANQTCVLEREEKSEGKTVTRNLDQIATPRKEKTNILKRDSYFPPIRSECDDPRKKKKKKNDVTNREGSLGELTQTLTLSIDK